MNNIVHKISEICKNPILLRFKVQMILGSKFPNVFSDKFFLEGRYYLEFRKRLNLKNPVTFNEKLQWLKLYNRNPKYIMMVDKYAAKKYVSNIIGEKYIIPTYGVWNNFEEIDFEELPNQFVLKTTHDSGSVIICKNKNELDLNKARKTLTQSLCHDYYLDGREWPYKGVHRKLIAEKFIDNKIIVQDENAVQKSNTEGLNDYKFFCFDGKVKALFIATDRFSKTEETKFDFFDENFSRLPFRQGHPTSEILPGKPQCFEEMKHIAEKLSGGIPHVRVDLYESQGRIFFGELTFFHFSGFMPFSPELWDEIFGQWIDLTKFNNEYKS